MQAEIIIPRLPLPQLTLFFMLRKYCQKVANTDYDNAVFEALFDLMYQGGGHKAGVCLSTEEAIELAKQYDLAGGWICKVNGNYVFLPRLPDLP